MAGAALALYSHSSAARIRLSVLCMHRVLHRSARSHSSPGSHLLGRGRPGSIRANSGQPCETHYLERPRLDRLDLELEAADKLISGRAGPRCSYRRACGRRAVRTAPRRCCVAAEGSRPCMLASDAAACGTHRSRARPIARSPPPAARLAPQPWARRFGNQRPRLAHPSRLWRGGAVARACGCAHQCEGWQIGSALLPSYEGRAVN